MTHNMHSALSVIQRGEAQGEKQLNLTHHETKKSQEFI